MRTATDSAFQIRPARLESAGWLSGVAIPSGLAPLLDPQLNTPGWTRTSDPGIRNREGTSNTPRTSSEFLRFPQAVPSPVRGRGGAIMSVCLTDSLTVEAATAASCQGLWCTATRGRQTMPAPPHRPRRSPVLLSVARALQRNLLPQPSHETQALRARERCRKKAECPLFSPAVAR